MRERNLSQDQFKENKTQENWRRIVLNYEILLSHQLNVKKLLISFMSKNRGQTNSKLFNHLR